MIPLILTAPGEESVIKKVGGTPEVRQHLETLGFTSGTPVTVVSSMGGNVIVRVRDARIAVSENMAAKIMV